MPRRPLGVYVRNTPDWFSRSLASVAGFRNIGASGTAFDLFNDSTTGQYIHVLALLTNPYADGPQLLHSYQGKAANFVQKALPVLAGGPAPAGSLYYDDVAQTDYNNDHLVHSDAWILTDVSGAAVVMPPFGPLAILPPGYSFRYLSNVGPAPDATTASVTFYYSVLPDAGN